MCLETVGTVGGNGLPQEPRRAFDTSDISPASIAGLGTEHGCAETGSPARTGHREFVVEQAVRRLRAGGPRPSGWSSRLKLGFAVVLGMAGMAAVISWLLLSTARTLFEREARAELAHENQIVANELDMLAAKAADDLRLARQNPSFDQYYLATDDATRAAALAGIQSVLLYLQQLFTIDEICVINRLGAESARCVQGRLARFDQLSPDETGNPFFEPSLRLKEGEIYRSPVPYMSEDTNEWVVAHATPIILPDGTRAGILHFEIPLSWFAAKVESNAPTGGFSFLMSRDGRLIVHPRLEELQQTSGIDPAGLEAADFPSGTASISPSFQRLVERMQSGQAGHGSYGDGRGAYEVVYQPVFGGNWVAASVLPRAVIYQPVNDLLRRTLLIALPLLGLALWYSAKVVAPLQTRVLRQNEARFRSLVQNASDIIVVLDEQQVVRYVSPSIERVLGYQPDALVGTSVLDSVHEDDVAQVKVDWSGVGWRGAHRPVELRVLHANGSWRSIEAVATNLVDDPGVNGIVINARDSTDRRHLEEELTRQAFHDVLTGLPNRALFMDRLGQALARAGRHGTSLAILFLDLDNFKVVNDSLGHQVGDQLLCAVAERLHACVRQQDTVARLGGDEFTILLEDITDAGDAIHLADRIAEHMKRPVLLGQQEVFITTSIGIAVSSGSEDGPDDLLRTADVALYDAKGRGKARHAVFDAEMNTRAQARLEMETDLRRAIERGELRLHYQPIVRLVTGEALGVEALVRWEHPQHGLLSPAQFIPLAEETGLIVPLEAWVLEQACRQVRSWQVHEHGAPELMLSINVSARHFAQPGLVDEVAQVLQGAGLPPRTLQLEITESVAMADAGAAVTALSELKKLGIQLAIDDFGTGYSSLGYLKRFPVDTLKIDRSFVDGLGQDHEDSAIVRAVLAVANALNLNVTAEGIETWEQLDELLAHGCAQGQGYLFARPLSAEDAEVWLIADSPHRYAPAS
jgi:diguanylate cyclase (GGDEF)-like protein/PAS domain S-box-containing protein